MSTTPLMEVPIVTPVLSASAPVSSPLCARASLAAAKAYCANREESFASLLGICSSALKFLICAATLTGISSFVKRSSLPMPDRPEVRFFQNSATLTPIGVTAPMPVIAILFIFRF